MSIPSFKVSSKPTISQTEFDSNKKSDSKFINEPGTYSMIIKSITFDATPKAADSAWIGSQVVLSLPAVNKDGKEKDLKMFLDVPTECRNGFLFGPKKETYVLEKLVAFFRGLGIVFDYENGMQQVGAVFGNPDALIGKPISVRLGYRGPHAKYVAKDDYVYVDKDHVTQKIEGHFANKEAVKAAVESAGLKYFAGNDFINVLEVFPAKEAVIDIEAPAVTVDSDLPF